MGCKNTKNSLFYQHKKLIDFDTIPNLITWYRNRRKYSVFLYNRTTCHLQSVAFSAVGLSLNGRTIILFPRQKYLVIRFPPSNFGFDFFCYSFWKWRIDLARCGV